MAYTRQFASALMSIFLQGIVVNSNSFAADMNPSYLVRAKVAKIHEKTKYGRFPITLEVIHVYMGPADLNGKTFKDYQYSGPRSAGNEAIKPFTLDEEGLWPLNEVKGELQIGSFAHLPFLRSRKEEINPRHTQHLLLAEAIEKFTNAKPAVRTNLAEKLANDSTPEVCYWMVRTLGDTDEKFASELLEKWRKNYGELPLRSQIALDEVICIKEKEDWFTALKRAEMLKSWVARKTNEYDAHLVLSRLYASFQAFEMRGEAVIELLQVAAGNKDWRKEDRIKAIGSVGYQANRIPDFLAAYDWLFDLMKNSPEIEFRRRAAYEVGALSLYPKRIQAVEDFLTTEKDPEIIKTLRAALKKAKESEKK